ncbi:LacI family DNA-binding transcriptional regulator [Botrimarina hoheduenensis]|uniref:Catabolite control protein A n=1 Tax=Botrimarina hoheduenensis TaxID=2528000 RepID=A0A5C5WAE9_9BACT|nr:LacI family DNA-binding transcriptional regulator [Botrimarina hoheduenensis]TWT47544.1 Catabolite control protein A [Botrimarina hoheduenensis]
MAASIEDVAKRANVSISTVSRVLNRRNIVNSETRKRVEEAIDALGYRPNVFARGLMLRKSNILGLVLPDLHGEFYSEIIRGANQKTRELGYHMLVSSVTADDDGHDVLSAVGTQGLVDGIVVMVTEMSSRIRTSLSQADLPMVLLDGDVPGVKHDSVVIDQQRGAAEMVRHLLDSSPGNRVLFIGGHDTNLDTIDRLTAYRKVLAEHGLQPGRQDIVHLDYSYETAFDYASQHVLAWAEQPTTIFAANDEMAAGVVDAAIAATLSVPDELKVVGFDDTRIAQLTRPRLTTVRVPKSEMGAAAVELLCARLKEPGRPSTRITLQTELVVRESCGGR